MAKKTAGGGRVGTFDCDTSPAKIIRLIFDLIFPTRGPAPQQAFIITEIPKRGPAALTASRRGGRKTSGRGSRKTGGRGGRSR